MTKPNPLTEEALQMQVADYLDRFLPDDAFFFHVPNGGLRNKVVAAKLKRQGVKAGVLDNAILRRNTINFIELKVGKNTLSDPQEVFAGFLEMYGIRWAVCYSLDEVASVCERWFPMKAKLSA